MIHVHEASKSFGRTRAVRGVSFELEPGRITGLLGPNGAGKTTTIRMIAGFLAPDSGRITVSGLDLATDTRAAQFKLGYLPESAPLYPELTPTKYLDYRARLYNLGRTDRKHAVAHVIDRCRLADMADKRIGVLSKGYRQRVGLAAALLHDPPALILDEPTNGLDPAQIRSTRALIGELAEDRTVLLCTHIIPEVERICGRVLVIARGRLVADDTPDRLAGGQGAVEMVCRGPGCEMLCASLEKQLGARRFDLSDDSPGWVRITVCGVGGGDLDDTCEALHRAASDAGRAVRRLAPARTSLEERVIGLIETEQVAFGGSSA